MKLKSEATKRRTWILATRWSFLIHRGLKISPLTPPWAAFHSCTRLGNVQVLRRVDTLHISPVKGRGPVDDKEAQALKGVVRSIQVGLPQEILAKPDEDLPNWRTGFVKTPVAGPVWLGKLNLAGDGQADLQNHGGPDKAVLGYAALHYAQWQVDLHMQLPYGAFGENFTLDGLSEDTVCIGDVYQIGDAVLQVSQPRGPCWKISRRWGIPDLLARVQNTGRTGWYFRVLQEGGVQAGDAVYPVSRVHPDLSISVVSGVVNAKQPDLAMIKKLADCEELAQGWRDKAAKRL